MNDLILLSTYKLLKDTFGDELPEKYYEAVIVLMSEGLCHENLIKAVGSFKNIGQDRVDCDYPKFLAKENMQKIQQTDEYHEAFTKLRDNGFFEWLEEPD
ncbi:MULTISPECIES: hypothetical protein [unclassified Bartonella]|nr:MULTISPECIES: hypothetical protein [unclassified Bartonella]UXN04895.1 hypothetical protein N6B01_14415 [Bartonella sp. HY406]UXN07945.1 hypothetical protein N6A79_15170 [Bartonella sp. HY761]